MHIFKVILKIAEPVENEKPSSSSRSLLPDLSFVSKDNRRDREKNKENSILLIYLGLRSIAAKSSSDFSEILLASEMQRKWFL